MDRRSPARLFEMLRTARRPVAYNASVSPFIVVHGLQTTNALEYARRNMCCCKEARTARRRLPERNVGSG